MVRFHQSVDTCPCPRPARTTSNRRVLEQALVGAQILMRAGHEAVGEGFDEIVSNIFERYFGRWTQSKRAMVQGQFAKMQKLVDHEADVDVTIHLGTDHLSGQTTILLPGAHGWYSCVTDLTKVTYDERGTFIDQASTWPVTAITHFRPGVSTPTAYCVGADDGTIGSTSGTHVFINPETLAQTNVLAPFVLDEGSLFKPGDKFDKILKLPGTIFHELCHSVLLGHKDERMRDMVVTPAMLGANRYLLGPQSAQAPETAHCVYGEELCWAAARLNDDDSWKVLQNPESYLCFSLVVFMFYHNSTDFADGYLKVGDDAAPIRQSSTRGSAGSVRTLADCVYSISDRTVKDIWDKYKDRLKA